MSAATSTHRVLAAASVLAVVLLAIVGIAGGAPAVRDTSSPSVPTDIRLVSATASSVEVAWQPSIDDVKVVAYAVSGEVPPERVRDSRYVGDRLPCGESLAIVVVALDRAGNRSSPAHAIVATAPCRDVTPPSTPSGFRQAATTQSAVVLAWNPSSDDTGVVAYGVYQGTASIASTTEPAFTLSNLACGTTHAVAVDAADAAGNRSGRGSVWVETAACPNQPPAQDTTPPSQPTSLSLSSATSGSILLGWASSSDNVGVVGYDVFADGSKAGTTSASEYEVGGLQCGSTYALAVVAYDAAGNRSDQTGVDGSTSACASIQRKPTEWAMCARERERCSFSGTKEVRYGKDSTWTEARQLTDGVSCSNEVFGDPLPGTEKECHVRDLASTDAETQDAWTTCASEHQTCSFAGTRDVRYGKGSTWTNPRQFTDGVTCSNEVFGDPLPGTVKECHARRTQGGASPKPGDTTPPSQPGSVTLASATQTSVTLSWAASSDDVNVAGYGIYRDASLVSTVALPGATVTGLACGKAYALAVDAFDAAGNRSDKTSVTGTTAVCSDGLAPSTPSNVQATSRTATSIALSWSASTDNVGVAGYGLYRGGVLVGTSTTTTGIFAGLACNTNYTLAVDAYDAAGHRSAKATVGVATTSCADTSAPSTPTGLQVSSVSQTGFTLSWTASSDNVGVTGYDAFLQSGKVGTTRSTSYAYGGLACGTSYSVGVQAFDAAGNGSGRSTANASTSACAPSSEWRLCAAEHQHCSFSGTREVRYGKNTTWTSPRQFTDGVACSNGVFGDPLPGTAKECQMRDVSGTPSSTSPPSSISVAYPASYFTGPLGARNPVPTKRGAFLIGWLGMPGGATTWDQYKARVLQREAAMGRKYDGIMVTDFRDQGEWADNRLGWVNEHGSIPIVAGLNFGRTIAQINAGEADSTIDAYADRYRSYGFTIMIRLHHEFNYSHLAYTSVGQESAFVAAWRRIVDRFRARGATNVGFWWTPAEGGTSQERASADAAYPGDAYVDWVGSDQYNHCYVNESGCYSTPYRGGWANFDELFDYAGDTRHARYGPRKPFIVGETGTVWDPSNPAKKGEWFRNIPGAAKNMEYLTGVAFFDIDATPWESSRNNWIVDHNASVPEVYNGFIAMARDPWFNTRS